MDTQLLQPSRSVPALDIDFIGDLACPWSYLSLRSLGLALGSLYGAPARPLRWHGLPLAGMVRSAWRPHLAGRAPGRDVDQVQADLVAAGRRAGIEFDFGRIACLPDTREAHRLVHLASGEGHQVELIDALFRAFFEQGQDISDPKVLAQAAREAGLAQAASQFADSADGRDQIIAEEHRLRGLGVENVPQLIFNSRVMVPGPADVATCVQALDQAVFPGLGAAAAEGRVRLH